MSEKIPSTFRAEKSDKAIFLRQQGCDLQINFVISFSGQLDSNLLAKALRLTFDAEPILGCKYIDNGLKPFWLRRDDLDQIASCPVINPPDIDQAIYDFLTSPIGILTSPLIQIIIFRSSAGDTLCLKANHMVTDASGLKKFAHLLSHTYRQLTQNYDYRVDINLKGRRSNKQVLSHLNCLSKLKMIRRGYRNWRSDISPPQNWSFPFVNAPPSKKMFIIRTINQALFKATKEYGQKFKMTINDVMVTAFYRALSKVIQPAPDTPLRLYTTTDLRRYIPNRNDEAICNLAGMAQLNIGNALGEKFGDTLLQVHQIMKELKGDYLGLGVNRFDLFNYPFIPHFIAKWLCRQITRINHWLAPQQVPPYITNMGIIEERQLNFGNIAVTKAYLTAPLAYPPMFIIGFSGFKQTITMSIGFYESNAPRATVNRLLDYVEEELVTLTGIQNH